MTRRARHLAIRSFDDPRLTSLRIGVPLVGDDGANAPPAHALARRGIVANVIGYSVVGDYRQESPPSRLIAALARDEIDVAAAWGPLAGYFAARQGVALRIQPVDRTIDASGLPFAFDICMALSDYHVPRTDAPLTKEAS